MPVHDWTRVDAGLFHDFQLSWLSEVNRRLNRSVLSPDYFSLIEQSVRSPSHSFSDIHTGEISALSRTRSIGISVLDREPKVRFRLSSESTAYARKADCVTVRHRDGDVVAVIEIISPGNKASLVEFRNLVEKSADLIRAGIHLLVIDLFPPGRRDPFGLHKAIWDQFEEEDLELPPGKPLTLASYDAGSDYVAYVEFVGVGDPLPDMPLFLKPDIYVPAPLEASYQAAWDVFPRQLKGLLEPSNGKTAAE